MIVLQRYGRFFERRCVPAVQPLGEVVCPASGCCLPSLRRGGTVRETNGGISSLRFSEGLNAEVQTFRVPETCCKACSLTARRLAGWWILREVLRACLRLVRLLPDARVSDPSGG